MAVQDAGDPIRDHLLARAIESGAPAWELWEPERELVVLGRSNDPARECDLDACRAAGVPVLKRRGGGGAVVLARGMLVVTLAGPHDPGSGRLRAGERIQSWIAAGLARAGVPGAVPRGLGDLALGERKVLGSSMAFRRGHVLYQGVLLVSADLAHIDALLRHPSREPDYRRGRSHGQFVTSLAAAGYRLTPAELRGHLLAGFDAARALELSRGPGRHTSPTPSTPNVA